MKFAKKSLGQNFLIDKNIIKKIIDLVVIKDKKIIEIGPGKGALTEEILNRKPKLLSLIEKDSRLVEELRRKYCKNNNIKIYNADVLKINLKKIICKGSIIFGNLPYNISSQILVKILKINSWPINYTDMVLMFQKELADKILGKFATSNYGRLSIITNYKLDILNKFLVSPNCFFPKPKVNSQILHFKPKKTKLLKIKDLNNLEKVTNIIFSNKRKMINKNLSKVLKKKDIIKIKGLKTNLRPSEIKPDIYYKITELFEQM